MPDPLESHAGIAGALMIDNVDTDQIIPSREMRAVSRNGLANGLFAGWRYAEAQERVLRPDFILNREPRTSILVSGHNFGCGSSREHAVWALAQFGIRIIIAKSFGEIFHGNCIRNGLLPVTLASGDVDEIAEKCEGQVMQVNVREQTVQAESLPGWLRTFQIDAFSKRMILEGLDPIRLTLKDAVSIASFQEGDRARRPWVYS
jgi:3-isopropylmalate/(R)-2-methylmalate dehydratase small subunit